MASKSFSARLSLNILRIVSILFIVALAVVAVSSHVLMSREATRSATNMLEANIAKIETTLTSVEINTQNAAWIAEANQQDEARLFAITQAMVERNPYIVGSAIAFDSSYRADHQFFSPYSFRDTDNVVKSKLLGTEGVASFEEEWYRIPMATGECHWSEPYFDEGGGEMMMSTYSYPLKDKNGKVYAVVTADIALEWLDDLMQSIHPYEHTHATLATAQGHYLVKGKTMDLSKQTIFSTAKFVKDPRAAELAKNMAAGKKGTMRYTHHGKASFAVYGPLKNRWTMSIVCQYNEVLAQTSQMHMILILVGLFGLLIMFIICYRTIRHLTQPLTEFSVSALNMAKGNFKAQLPEINTEDEMLRLHDSFAYMQKSINTYISELRTTTTANERMESELNIARAIQLGMLPKNFPKKENFELHALLYPAKEVGGDLYDFVYKDSDNSLYFAVGDVSGKGVPAALVMAITRAACRFFAGMGMTMQQIAEHLNNSVADGNEANMFATLFVGNIDLNTGKMEFCNAGHNSIIIIPADENEPPYYYKAIPNLAIGLFPDFSYQMESISLQPGTRLLVYTDGVSEAETKKKELFGDDRLLAVASTPDFRKMSSEDMTNTVYSAVKNHANGNEQNDDITIMAIVI